MREYRAAAGRCQLGNWEPASARPAPQWPQKRAFENRGAAPQRGQFGKFAIGFRRAIFIILGWMFNSLEVGAYRRSVERFIN